MLISNLIIIPMFIGFIYFMSKVATNEKLLKDNGDFAPGINLPSLKLKPGEKLKRKTYGAFLTKQMTIFSVAMVVSTNLMYYFIENRVFNEITSVWIMMGLVGVALIYLMVKILNVKKYRHRFIEKGENNEETNN